MWQRLNTAPRHTQLNRYDYVLPYRTRARSTNVVCYTGTVWNSKIIALSLTREPHNKALQRAQVNMAKIRIDF